MRSDKILINNLRLAKLGYYDATKNIIDIPNIDSYTFFVQVGNKWLNAFRPFNECNVYDNEVILANGKQENGICYILEKPLNSLYGHSEYIKFGELVKNVCMDLDTFYLDRKYLASMNNEFVSDINRAKIIFNDFINQKNLDAFLKNHGEKKGYSKFKSYQDEKFSIHTLKYAEVAYNYPFCYNPVLSNLDPYALFVQVGGKWINVLHPLIDCNVYLTINQPFKNYELVNGNNDEGICYILQDEPKWSDKMSDENLKCKIISYHDAARILFWDLRTYFIDRWDLCFAEKGFASEFDKTMTYLCDKDRRQKYKEYIEEIKKERNKQYSKTIKN